MSLNFSIQEENSEKQGVKSYYGGPTAQQVEKYRLILGLSYNSGEPDPLGNSEYYLNNIRIRMFMYHHFGDLSNNNDIGYRNTPPSATQFTWNSQQVNVTTQYQLWRSDVYPTRFHDNRFTSEVSFYPVTSASNYIANEAGKTTATNAIVYLAGKTTNLPQGGGDTSVYKIGRFYDCENSHSFIPFGTTVTNPSKTLLEYRIDSKTRNIQSAVANINEITVTTTTAHPYVVGDAVTIKGVTEVYTSSVDTKFNMIAKVTWVSPDNLQFKYTTKNYYTSSSPSPINATVAGATVEYYTVLRGDIPSLAVAANYSVISAPNVDNHLAYTYLRYPTKDTAISYRFYQGGPQDAINYGSSDRLPVTNGDSSRTIDISAYVFDKPSDFGAPYKGEFGFFCVLGNNPNMRTQLVQMTNNAWSESSTWSTLYPQIDPSNDRTNPAYTYVSKNYYNADESDEWTYSRFVIGDMNVDWVDDGTGSTIIENWLNGTSPLSLGYVKTTDFVVSPLYFVSRDVTDVNYKQLQPFILLTNAGAITDETPPTTTITNANIYSDIVSITGSVDTAQIEVSTDHYLSIGSVVSVFGTDVFDGYEFEVTNIVDSTTFDIEILGNVDTSTITGGYIRRDSDILIEGHGSDDIKMSTNIEAKFGTPPAIVSPEYTTLANQQLLEFGVVNTLTTSDYFDVRSQDDATNWSSTIKPPVVAEYYKNISSVWTKDALNIKTGDLVLIRGYNTSSYTTNFSYVAGDPAFGGHRASPIQVTVSNGNLLPSEEGFSFTVPTGLQTSYTVSSVNTSTNQITLVNASTVVAGSIIVFGCNGKMYDPIEIGKPYYVLTSTPSGGNRIITISETDGGSVVDILATVGVGTSMVAYNRYFPLSVLRDSFDSRTYFNYIEIPIDDAGPLFTLPTSMYLNDVITVRVSDPYGIDTGLFDIIGGTIDSMVDVQGDGNVIDLTITLTNTGTFSLTAYDLSGNRTTLTNVVAGVDDPVITIDSITVTSRNNFVMVGRVIDDNIPVQYAANVSSQGLFIAGSLNQSIGSTVITGIAEGLRFTTTFTSRGDGVMKIYAKDGDDNTDTLIPLIITDVDPTCFNTGDTVRVYGMNLGYPNTDLTPYAIDAVVAAPSSMMNRDMVITSSIDGSYDLVFTDTIDGDYVVSNSLNVTLDNTPPIISLNGDQVIYAEYGSGPYSDAGATAFDVISGVIPPNEIVVTGVNDVDTNALGEYTVTYTATDDCGNSSQATRTIIVYGGDLVISITNPTGVVGDVVEINATECEFNSIAINNVVTFNGTIAQVVGGDLTTLYVIIPVGATTGPVMVDTFTEECGTSNTVNFTVIYEDVPFTTDIITRQEQDTRGIQLARPLGSAIYNRDMSFSGYREIIDENSMVQNVYNILLTSTGERIFNLGFGSRLQSYVFKPMSNLDVLNEELLSDVTNAIQTYEPRVLVDRANSAVIAMPDTNEMYLILSILVPSGARRELGISLKSHGSGV